MLYLVEELNSNFSKNKQLNNSKLEEIFNYETIFLSMFILPKIASIHCVNSKKNSLQ